MTFFSLPDLAGLLCSKQLCTKQLFFVIAFPFNSNANQVLFCPSSSRRFVVIMMPLVCKLKHLLISISKARFRYRTFRTIRFTRQLCHPLPVYFRTFVKTKPMTYRNALLRITPPPPPQRLGLSKARMRYQRPTRRVTEQRNRQSKEGSKPHLSALPSSRLEVKRNSSPFHRMKRDSVGKGMVSQSPQSVFLSQSIEIVPC